MQEKLKDCTFSPKINGKRNPRDFNEFLKDQEKKQKIKENFIREQSKEKTIAETAALRPKPQINEVILYFNKNRVLNSLQSKQKKIKLFMIV